MNASLLYIAQAATILFGGGGAYTFFRANSERKKIHAEAKRVDIDAAKLVSESAIVLLEPMQARITSLTKDLDKAMIELSRANARIAALTSDVESAQRLITELRDQLHMN